MPITTLPAAPDRQDDPANFATKADNLLGALALFVTQANTLEANVNAKESTATTLASTATAQATIATTKATEAAASAASALTNSATQATSVTSLSIGYGTKSLTLAQTGKSFVVGQWVTICDMASPSSRWMLGAITAFTSGTGAMTVEVPGGNFAGSGSYTGWTIAASAPTANPKTDRALAILKFIGA